MKSHKTGKSRQGGLKKQLLLGPAVIASSVALWAGGAHAQGQEINVEIEAQRTDLALLQLAEKSGIQIVFSDEVGKQTFSQPISGQLTLENALQQIVAKTGLTYEFTSSNLVVVHPTIQQDSHLDAAQNGIVLAQATEPAPSPAPEPAPKADSTARLNTVMVTARRREESLQDVPTMITALDTEALLKAGVKDVSDLQYATPGMTIAPGFFGKAVPGFTIRGQRVGEPLATQDNSVIVYMDDVPLNRPHGVGQILYDLDNAQVLKGPQGTLFGRNTTGGAILANTKKPDFDAVSGYLEVLGGNYNHYAIEGAVNTPITDSLAVRVAGRMVRRDGFTDDIADGQDVDDDNNESLRISALWAPTDALEVHTIFQTFHMDTAGLGWALQEVNPSGPFPATVTAFLGQPEVVAEHQAQLDDLKSRDFHTVSNDQINDEKVDTWHIANTISYDFGNITLKNIFGYRAIDTFAAFDYDGSNTTYTLPGDGTEVSIFNSNNTLEGDQISNELQALGSAFDDQLDWIVGAFYFKEDNFDDQQSDLFGRRSNTGSGINTSSSLFASGTYRTPIDGLSVTGGMRYTWDKRQLLGMNTIQGLFSPSVGCRLTDEAGAALDPCLRDVTEEFEAPSWTFSVDYKFTDAVLGYVAHRHGYRSGGWNLRSTSAADTIPFEPETVDDIELGVKSQFAIGGADIRLNAAYFHQWYNDVQQTVTAPTGTDGALVTAVRNAATAKLQGLEIDFNLTTNYFELSAFTGLLDASFDEFNETIGFEDNGDPIIRDNSAKEFAYAPAYTGGATARFILPVSPNLGEMSLTANWFITDEFYGEVTNDGGAMDGYNLTNFYADWNDVMNGPVDLRFFMKNAFDEEYYTSGLTLVNGLGFSAKTIGDPRTFGVQARYEF